MSDFESKIKFILKSFDKDGDGYLNFEEFATSRKVLAGDGSGSYSKTEYEADCNELFDEVPEQGIGLRELKVIYEDEEEGLQEDYDCAKKYFAASVPAPSSSSSSSATSVSSTKSNIMVERVFKHFDKDKDGLWSFQEAKKATQILSNNTRELSREEFDATCEETYADPDDGLEEEHILCTYINEPTRLRKDYRTVIRESCRDKTEDSKPDFGFTKNDNVKPSFFSVDESPVSFIPKSDDKPVEVNTTFFAQEADTTRRNSSSAASSKKAEELPKRKDSSESAKSDKKKPVSFFGVEEKPKEEIVNISDSKKEEPVPAFFFGSKSEEPTISNIPVSRKSSSSLSRKSDGKPTQEVDLPNLSKVEFSSERKSSIDKPKFEFAASEAKPQPAFSRKSSSSSSQNKNTKSDVGKVAFFGHDTSSKSAAIPPELPFREGTSCSSSVSSSSSTRSNIMVERIFTQFDIDKDGFWSFPEAREAKQQLSGEVMTMNEFVELCETTFAEPEPGLAEEQLRAIYSEEGSNQLKADYKSAIKISCSNRKPSVSTTSARAEVETFSGVEISKKLSSRSSSQISPQRTSQKSEIVVNKIAKEESQSVPPPQLDTLQSVINTSWRERRESFINSRTGVVGVVGTPTASHETNNLNSGTSNNQTAATSSEAKVITMNTPVKMAGLPHPETPLSSYSRKTSIDSTPKPSPPKLEHPSTPSVNSEFDVDEAIVWQSRSRAATNFTRLPLKTDSVKNAYVKKMEHCYVKEDISLLKTRLRATQEEKALLELLVIRHSDLGVQLKAALHVRVQDEKDRLHLGRQREERLGCYSEKIFNAPSVPVEGAPHHVSNSQSLTGNISDVINFIEDRCSSDLHLYNPEELHDAISHHTKEHTNLSEILSTVDDLMMLIKTTLEYRIRQKNEHLQYRERAADRMYKRQLIELTKTEKYLENTSVGHYRF